MLSGTSSSRRPAVQRFYAQQNDLIDAFMETQHIHRGVFTNDRTVEDAQAQKALNLSFAANVVLLAVRLGIALVSGSLSLLIATLDAVLDVISSGGCQQACWGGGRCRMAGAAVCERQAAEQMDASRGRGRMSSRVWQLCAQRRRPCVSKRV